MAEKRKNMEPQQTAKGNGIASNKMLTRNFRRKGAAFVAKAKRSNAVELLQAVSAPPKGWQTKQKEKEVISYKTITVEGHKA